MTIEEVNKKQIWELIKPVEELVKQTSVLKHSIQKQLEETKQKILKVSNQITFIEGEHRYFHENKECIAVSNLVDIFCQETDFDLVAQNYAKKNNCKESWQRIRQIWTLKGETATTNGTFVHQYGEDLNNICNGDIEKAALKNWCFINGYYYPVNPKAAAIYKYFEYLLSNYEIPFLAEIKLILKDHEITGTFDQLVYSTREKGYIIRDYKTNEELQKGFKKPMKAPFELYNDEPLSHYILQQNIYSLMLREIGVPILRKELVWLKDNETFILVKLPDIEDKMLKAIEDLY